MSLGPRSGTNGSHSTDTAGDFLGGGGEMLLTEMNDAELLKLVALDLNAAIKES